MRAFRGYGSITQQSGRGWTDVPLAAAVAPAAASGTGSRSGSTTRSASTIVRTPTPRLQHAADGTFSIRADQAEADRLLGNNDPQAHIMKANFVWDLPDLRERPALRKALGLIVNDWQLSGIWTGATGTPTPSATATRTAAAT